MDSRRRPRVVVAEFSHSASAHWAPTSSRRRRPSASTATSRGSVVEVWEIYGDREATARVLIIRRFAAQCIPDRFANLIYFNLGKQRFGGVQECADSQLQLTPRDLHWIPQQRRCFLRAIEVNKLSNCFFFTLLNLASDSRTAITSSTVYRTTRAPLWTDRRTPDATRWARSPARTKSAPRASSTRLRSRMRREHHRNSDEWIEVSQKFISGQDYRRKHCALSAQAEWRKLISIEDNQMFPFSPT